MLGFDAQKAIEAAAHLLKRAPGKRMNYMRLCKLLYLADRRSLELRRSPMIGDKPWAMEQGPVPGTTLDLIKGFDPESSHWSEFIEKLGYEVALTCDPGNLSLSRAELKILDALSCEFRDLDEWALVKWCHENLPEFEKNDPMEQGKLRVEIPIDDILDAVGRLSEKNDIIQQVNENIRFTQLFQSH